MINKQFCCFVAIVAYTTGFALGSFVGMFGVI